MQTKRSKLKSLIGIIAIAGLWLPMADGCHKHSKVLAAEKQTLQTAVGDEQFLRSMIPHYAGAILMCEQASISDPEIKRLCESIRTSQQSEIDQMKAKLAEIQAK